MTDVVLRSSPSPHVALLTLNRPQVRNSLNQELRDVLVDHLQRIALDPEIRVAVIAGNERAFVAGADIASMAKASPQSMNDGRSHLIWQALSRFQKPLIAAVRGYALGGGCELAMACDLIVASETAVFGQPEIKVGIMPGAGGVSRLMRRIGRPRAMQLLMTGATINGRQAADWGLVSEAVPDVAVLDRALSLAAEIAALPLNSALAIKAVAELNEQLPLNEALIAERTHFLALFDTPDQREGMAAFLEKRRPQFNTTAPDAHLIDKMSPH